jgi:hypothetical protein
MAAVTAVVAAEMAAVTAVVAAEMAAVTPVVAAVTAWLGRRLHGVSCGSGGAVTDRVTVVSKTVEAAVMWMSAVKRLLLAAR